MTTDDDKHWLLTLYDRVRHAEPVALVSVHPVLLVIGLLVAAAVAFNSCSVPF